MFADSSKEVAAAIVYLRVCNGEEHSVSLVAAKTSTLSQPEVKRQFIPQKKLIVLDIVARLLKQCLDSTSLPISDYKLWSDSQTVINWCSSKTLELRVFERNRVDSILKNSKGKFPSYIPTEENPADIASRGCSLSQTNKWNFWLDGPEFLWKPTSMWKPWNPIDDGVQKPSNAMNFVMSVTSNPQSDNCNNTDIGFLSYTLDRTMKLSKAIRVIIAVFRCFKKWKGRLEHYKTEANGLKAHAASLILVQAA